MLNNVVVTDEWPRDLEDLSRFQFVADAETIDRFYEFIAANKLEIDAPVAIEWWRHHGPQFDDQDHGPRFDDALFGIFPEAP